MIWTDSLHKRNPAQKTYNVLRQKERRDLPIACEKKIFSSTKKSETVKRRNGASKPERRVAPSHLRAASWKNIFWQTMAKTEDLR